MTQFANQATIYYLEDPRNGELKYVGKTIQPLHTRLKGHISVANCGHGHANARWIRSVLQSGFEPEIRHLETVKYSDWQDAERRWLIAFKASGASLNNEIAGGGGGDPQHKGTLPPEILAMFGRIPDHEIAKLSGLKRNTISDRRRSLGIAKCGNRPDKRTFLTLTPEIIARFGKEPDYKIASDTGISKSALQSHRIKLGIPSFSTACDARGRFVKGKVPSRWLKKDGD